VRLAGLGPDQRVGVPLGSPAAMTLDRGGAVTFACHSRKRRIAEGGRL
jgi:hypothetical protein